MSYYLYLDNDIKRSPEIAASYMYPIEVRFLYRLEEWIIVRDYEQFVYQVWNHGIPKAVSFDYDLGKEKKNGYDCAVWLLDYCNKGKLRLPQVFSHSQNPEGKEEILSLFRYVKQ